MKKVLIGIFAHPDDEAFGPSGTLLKLRDEGYELHLILLTHGEAGTNPDNSPNLGAVRLAEWEKAAGLLGATTHTAFDFPDGGLQTVEQTELDLAIDNVIKNILKEPSVISVMSFEPNGLTGHHDHIIASDAALRLFRRVPGASKLWYFCLDSTQAPLKNTAYYEPRGREEEYITTRIDIRQYLPKKHQIMDTHISQRADAAAMKKLGSTECFHVESMTALES